MQDDVIKAAIEKARDALAEGSCHGPCPADEPCMCRLDAVAAVIAFIRACPLVSDQPPGMDRMGFFDENARERWATAVERAAGGGA